MQPSCSKYGSTLQNNSEKRISKNGSRYLNAKNGLENQCSYLVDGKKSLILGRFVGRRGRFSFNEFRSSCWISTGSWARTSSSISSCLYSQPLAPLLTLLCACVATFRCHSSFNLGAEVAFVPVLRGLSCQIFGETIFSSEIRSQRKIMLKVKAPRSNSEPKTNGCI
jgi:hypothetical protein